ncbi:MAG TPA: hypothetical protein PKC21_09240 [Oligoflexia bacterium]|nr:hypothetical protein [Oligoflexia bacterium]HMR25522.1 hypothetical protein [Oligoflexia bacterium]
MKHNQTIKNIMTKTKNLQHLSVFALVISLSACSLSKPGDKDRSSMLNGDGSFQTISIKKKDPNNTTGTGDSGNDEEDAAALASASFSSGESIALGTFVSKIAEECGDSPVLHKIAHISGDLGLNLPAVRNLLDDAQKDKKESEKYSFEVLAGAIFGDDLGKEIVAGKSEPIVQWVNYCQKSEDDPTIYGWITDNTLAAQKTAYAPPMKPLFQQEPSLSLAWVQHHFINTLLDIKPALADTNVDLSSLKVAVYPLINSSIKDSQITARYEKTVAGDQLPGSLKLKFGSFATAVGEGINKDTPENEKILFTPGQYIIPTDQKTELNGMNEVQFSSDSAGVSNIYMKVNVLREDGTPDLQNFFTWIQNHLNAMSLPENERAVLLNTGTSRVVVPSAADISSMAKNASVADLASGENSSESEKPTVVDNTRDNSPETVNSQVTQKNKDTYYTLPSWLQGGTSADVVSVEEPPVVVVNKPKASIDASFNPFDGTDLECPEDYNLLSLNISCTDCLGPDLVAFEWSPEQLRAKNQTLENNDYYRLLDKTFGDNSAKTLLESKAGAQHTLNLCFNDENYKGSFTDQNFQETASAALMFFENNEEQTIVVEDHAGQKHMVIEVGYKAYYTAFPEVVTNLTTITGQTLLGTLDQHTLFFLPNAEGTHYSYTANPDMGPQIPIDQKKYARAQKVLKFMIPLNDLANLHAEIDGSVQVKIGAKNVAHRSYPPSPLLSAFDKLDYLITGDMSVASVRYARHDIDIFKSLGAKIIASVEPVVKDNAVDNSIDIANLEANMRRGSEEVETDHPGDYFRQSPSIDDAVLAQAKKENPLYGTTVIRKSSMIELCNNYAYRFGVSLKGRYTLVDGFEKTQQKLVDLSQTVPNVGQLLNRLVIDPIRNIANNTKRTLWNVYICSNTLDTGILSKNDYVAFLDTLPSAKDDIAGVFKISNPHSNIVIESNAKKNALLVGLDIVSFDVHDGERVGSYLDLPGIVVATIKNKPPTRINFQFTGEFSLDHRDITAASKPINNDRFHFADTVRRLRFEPSLDPITNTFEVVTEVRDTQPAVVIKDPVILHKNSLHYQGDQTFPGTGIDINKSFDGYLQTYGEFNAFQFGFWLEG